MKSSDSKPVSDLMLVQWPLMVMMMMMVLIGPRDLIQVWKEIPRNTPHHLIRSTSTWGPKKLVSHTEGLVVLVSTHGCLIISIQVFNIYIRKCLISTSCHQNSWINIFHHFLCLCFSRQPSVRAHSWEKVQRGVEFRTSYPSVARSLGQRRLSGVTWVLVTDELTMAEGGGSVPTLRAKQTQAVNVV